MTMDALSVVDAVTPRPKSLYVRQVTIEETMHPQIKQ